MAVLMRVALARAVLTSAGLPTSAVSTSAVLGAMGCGHAEPTLALAPSGSLEQADSPANAAMGTALPQTGPTWVSPGRVVPDLPVDGMRLVATQKDGSRWFLASGMRIIERPDGGIERARELLPSGAVQVVTLPPHLGGGLLLMATTTTASPVWRTTSWLGRLEPIVELWRSAPDLVVGFDRVYVRHAAAEWQAFDPRTGDGMSLGALPHATRIGAMAFADAWRGAVVADLLGPIATFDAGNSWHRIADSESVTGVRVLDEGSLAFDSPNGQLILGDRGELAQEPVRQGPPKAPSRFGTSTAPVAAPSAPPSAPPASFSATAAKGGHRRPLRAAIEDGWPLLPPSGAGPSAVDAVFVDGGALHRIRLADGAVLESRPGVVAQDASCHAIPFLSGFGFLCGRVAGDTKVFAFSTPFELREVISFSHPRFLSVSGNGGLVVRGACKRAAPGEIGTEVVRVGADSGAGEAPVRVTPSARPPTFCFFDRLGGEREIVFRGWEAAGEGRTSESREAVRPVALADGRAAFVVAPRSTRPGFLQIVSADSGKLDRVNIVVPRAARWLEQARWLSGIEERRPGVLSGWVESRGRFLGFELDLDGTVRVGEPPFPVAHSFVSGRFAFQWRTDGGVSLESTDGGFSAHAVDTPDSEVAHAPWATVACGPVGCSAGHWLRIGWGADSADPDMSVARTPKPFRATLTPPHPSFRLSCTPTGRGSGLASVPVGNTTRPAVTSTSAASAASPSQSPSPSPSRSPSPLPPRPAQSAAIGVVGRKATTAAAERKSPPPGWSPFRGSPAPLPAGVDVAALGAGTEALATVQARLYAWGTRGADWSRVGRFLVKFDDRFDWNGVRSTVATSSPWSTAEQAADSLGIGPYASTTSLYGLLDPAGDSALLVARHGVNRSDVYGLSRSEPVTTFRSASESFLPDPTSAVRLGSAWFFLGGSGRSGATALLLYRVDGGSARLLRRLPRISSQEPPPRLVHRVHRLGLGIWAQGPSQVGGRTVDWSVIPVNPDTGELSDPVRLMGSDLDGQSPRRCEPDDDGWLVDVIPTAAPTLSIAAWPVVRVDTVELRMRVDPGSSCVDAIAARVEEVGLRGLTSDESPKRRPPDLPLAATDPATGRRWELICQP